MCQCEQMRADLLALSPKKRAVLILSSRDHMSHQQIAALIGVTEARVEQLVAQALYELTIQYQTRRNAA